MGLFWLKNFTSPMQISLVLNIAGILKVSPLCKQIWSQFLELSLLGR